MKKPSKLQIWQRERFQLLGAVSGMRTRLTQLRKLPNITYLEQSRLDTAKDYLDMIARNWGASQHITREAVIKCQKMMIE